MKFFFKLVKRDKWTKVGRGQFIKEDVQMPIKIGGDLRPHMTHPCKSKQLDLIFPHI